MDGGFGSRVKQLQLQSIYVSVSSTTKAAKYHKKKILLQFAKQRQKSDNFLFFKEGEMLPKEKKKR